MTGTPCTTRRAVLRGAAAATVVAVVDGVQMALGPAEARARQVQFTLLTPEEGRSLELLGEALHPGAADAGLAHFIDSQLAAAVEDSLLIARHFLEPPYLGFYRAGLGALTAVARARHGHPFHELPPEAVPALVADLRDGKVEPWQGPPATLFYLVLRGDAADVVYATMEDFHERLDIPYMPHIVPPSRW
jgi:Gluconate 2-dehydrogenase subunit 3